MRFKAGSKNADVDLSGRGDGSKKLDAETKTLVRATRGSMTPAEASALVTGTSTVSAGSLGRRLKQRASRGI